jgi:UDP-hydrolysing UDP-N-acetyl-D-glucosamine 2-epimerase
MRRRRICFVSGTRAEFGLMRSTLRAIREHPKLQLQLVITGMHLDRTRGRSIDEVRRDGWKIDATVPWKPSSSPVQSARQTGLAIARLSGVISNLKSEIVLVVGDRVEAFAAATAAHLCGVIVAHVHGGDRALGQVDDALRHAITKLSHLHFPATRQSADRLVKLGEDHWRIHRVGTPGLDDLAAHLGERGSRRAGTGRTTTARREPRPPEKPFALIVLHPVDPDEHAEFERARVVLRATQSIPFERIFVIHPNNDPGADGIVRCWRDLAKSDRITVRPNVPRDEFLALLRDAAVMIGNSSSGIIEAASFGTPVIDIGPRQLGRERSENVTNLPYSEARLRRALQKIWNDGRPIRFPNRNVYGGPGAGARIARVLSTVPLDARLRRKLIAY